MSVAGRANGNDVVEGVPVEGVPVEGVPVEGVPVVGGGFGDGGLGGGGLGGGGGGLPTQMLPTTMMPTTAANVVPSDDEAIAAHLDVGTNRSSVHVAPESDDVQILPLSATAASFVPSDDEVIDFQSFVDPMDVTSVHDPTSWPHRSRVVTSDDVQMLPPSTTTANFIPSDDEAIARKSSRHGLFPPPRTNDSHVAPESADL